MLRGLPSLTTDLAIEHVDLMFVFSSLIKSEVLLVMKPLVPCMGPTKEYEMLLNCYIYIYIIVIIVIKANRTDLLTEVSLMLSGVLFKLLKFFLLI